MADRLVDSLPPLGRAAVRAAARGGCLGICVQCAAGGRLDGQGRGVRCERLCVLPRRLGGGTGEGGWRSGAPVCCSWYCTLVALV